MTAIVAYSYFNASAQEGKITVLHCLAVLEALASVCHDVYLKGSSNALFKKKLCIREKSIKVLKDQRSLGMLIW